MSNISDITKKNTETKSLLRDLPSRVDFQGVDGPCCCELTSYSSDPALLSVLLLLPLFVVITEDYGFKASAKSENLGWFSKTEELCTCLSCR